MLTGIYSFLGASWMLILDAPDVAFTEAAVGAGISTVLMLATLTLASQGKAKKTESGILVPLAIAKRGDSGQSMKGAGHGDAIAAGVSLARDLGNLPGNGRVRPVRYGACWSAGDPLDRFNLHRARSIWPQPLANPKIAANTTATRRRGVRAVVHRSRI